MDDIPLYNSRVTRTYIEYLKANHPDEDIHGILNSAGMTPCEIEDEGHWFTQRQVDRFHESLVRLTGRPDIAREAGRFMASSRAGETIRKFALGFITPAKAYSVLEKIASSINRSLTFTIQKINANTVEVTSRPKPLVNEKPYQCENRIGTLEALTKLLTYKYPRVEHPICIHRGGDRCLYRITWEKTPYLMWRWIRNYSLAATILACFVLFFYLPRIWWDILVLFCAVFDLSVFYYSESLEKKELAEKIESQGDAANLLVNQVNMRYNEALLIQEIGQATSKILDTDKLLKFVIESLEKRLDFDRGMIMLANKDKSRLLYTVGYGYNPEYEDYLKQTAFHLDRPESRGSAVISFRQQIPVIVEDINEIKDQISRRSLEFARTIGAESFICVPIIYEKESMGVLMVDNVKSKRRFSQSDVNLLMGIAPQIAISIQNATSYRIILESEERYRSIFENAIEGIFQITPNGEFIRVNPALAKMCGYGSPDEMTSSVRDIAREYYVDPEKCELFKKILDEQGYIAQFEAEVYRKDGGRIWVSLNSRVVRNDEGKPVYYEGTQEDITWRKQMEEEREKLQSQLLQAQKMESVGTLAGGIAHDFNNILMGIQGYTSLMLLHKDKKNPDYDKLMSIAEQVQSGADLTKQILGFARGGRYEIKPTDLNEIINKTSTMFGRTKKEVTINSTYGRSLWAVEVDQWQIEHVLLNLYVNAWQAMQGGGEIYLETQNILLDDSYAKAFAIRPGRYVKISVTDTGVGMDEKTKARIFEPFFTTKEMGRGTGLGLATVYGIIEGHQGIINVYSEKGHGTTFNIYLPASDKKVVGQVESPQDPVKGDETILVIDDEESILDVTKELLESLGYRVIAAKSGQEAIEIYRSDKEGIDLLILDMIMPGMGGGETFDLLKSMNPDIKVILSSGYSLNGKATSIVDRGCRSFIQKPYGLRDLSLKIREVLDSGNTMM